MSRRHGFMPLTPETVKTVRPHSFQAERSVPAEVRQPRSNAADKSDGQALTAAAEWPDPS